MFAKTYFYVHVSVGILHFFLREMDQKFIFGGSIGYGDSYLEFLFHHFKVFRLHAILHDAAGAVRAHNGKNRGYCYMIGRGPNSCLLGRVTELLFCFYVKNFLPSIFNSVDLRISMSCPVLDIELADRNVMKELGVLIEGKVREYSFRSPKNYKLTKQAFWCTRNLHGIVRNSGRLVYSELPNLLPRNVNGVYFAKGTEKCKLLASLMDKEAENLDDQVCPRAQNVVDEEIWICASYSFKQKTTLHCAEHKTKLSCNWIMRRLVL